MRKVSGFERTGFIVVSLLAGSVLGACSASSNDGSGSRGFGGSGGLILGGSGGIGTLPGAGGTGPGAGGVTQGPGLQNENTCTEAGKFAGASGSGRLLYPYDGTVFPRGLVGPLLMWDGAAQQILLELKSSQFSHTSCPATPDGVRYQIPDEIWARAGAWSRDTADALNVKVTAFAGGKATSSVSINLTFAFASLKGAIYYNTYGAPGSLSNGNGAILKIVPGNPQPQMFLTDTGLPPLGPCRSCHALSANGMTMTVNHHLYPGFYESESYDVAGPTPSLLKAGIVEAGFAGIYPDGSRMMTNGPPNVSASAFFPTAPGNVPALVQGTAHLVDPRTGNQIPSTGWSAPHAQMPMFSPKGDMIVYNDYDKGQGHSLFVASFDPATNTFSGHRQIFTHDTLYAAWPFFTPDSKKVIFAVDTRSDYASQVPDILGPPLMTPTGRGHLVMIDVASGQARPLDLANGWKNGQSYLPAGKDRDNELEFFPTVSPLAAGGYFWTFFTSRRTYGNISTLGLEDPNSKKIWAAAVDIDPAPGADPSHPAFLLPGQELQTGNVRAFAALEPCKEDGSSCTTGSECCKGYCSNVNAQTGQGVCGKVQTCSRDGDKCTEDSQCCQGEDNGAKGRRLFCIGGFCEVKPVM